MHLASDDVLSLPNDLISFALPVDSNGSAKQGEHFQQTQRAQLLYSLVKSVVRPTLGLLQTADSQR